MIARRLLGGSHPFLAFPTGLSCGMSLTVYRRLERGLWSDCSGEGTELDGVDLDMSGIYEGFGAISIPYYLIPGILLELVYLKGWGRGNADVALG
jgi:hypothetical protein